MRVLFPYPQEFGYFPDIYEYVSLLRQRGVEAVYVGVQMSNDDLEFNPFVKQLRNKNAGGREFVDFANHQIALAQPDIVHTFHFRGCGLLPIRARKSGSKWLVDVRTIHVETRDGRVRSDFWLRDRLTWLETQTFNHILALTEKIQRKLSPSLRPIDIFPLGANRSKLNPPEKGLIRTKTRNNLQIPADAPVIVYAGSLSSTRRIDKVIAGFSLILEDFQNARLMIIGGELGYDTHTDPSTARLMRLSSDLDIQSNVIFTGRVHYSEIPKYYIASDIGISYTPRGTPFQYQPATKLIEYMMAGLIASSNDVPSIVGLVEDNLNGILFGESPEEIANGMRRSIELLNLENRDSFLELTANARNSVRHRDWGHIVDQHLIPLYEKLCRR